MIQWSIFAAAPVSAGRETWEVELDALREAVALLTAKEVCFTLDIGPSALSDATAERDRKSWPCRWKHVVCAMLLKRGDEPALDVYRRIVAAPIPDYAPFAVVDSDEDATDEEVAAAERFVERAKRRRARRRKDGSLPRGPR